MPESGPSGSVRGAASDGRPYRDLQRSGMFPERVDVRRRLKP
jgi:hypothetical protein